MSTQAVFRRCILAVANAFLWWLAAAGMCLGQHDPPTPAPTSSTPNNSANDLDALLDLADKDIAHLTQVEVTAPALEMEVSTVDRQSGTVGQSPAAVFVITNEMIRRSGVRSIPEALRMAPGVHVARIDASKWAVSIRGFNSRFANKLLVQIDGRSIYSPLFGGVFWDAQDVVLEDIERIEVIRGPGATVWGANAVNGIINIITKASRDTQGVLVQGGAGTEQRGFVTTRYGGQAGENLYYRVYGKWFDRDEGYAPPDDAHDDWRMVRGGFRADWTPTSEDTVTLQGDYYDGQTGRRNEFPSLTPPSYINIVDDDAQLAGSNTIMRWTRQLDDETQWTAQVFYDNTYRHWVTSEIREIRDTFDVDFQHSFRLGERNAVIWGFGYRNTRGEFDGNASVIDFTPNVRAIDLFGLFVQDRITLQEDLWYFTLGSKFEYNDYTQFEVQPTVRLLWTPTTRRSVWASVSRAVRLPTQAENDMRHTAAACGRSPDPMPPPSGLPVMPVVIGNPDQDAEELMAYEAGIRTQATESFSWDLAVFYHDYDRLRSVPFATVPQPGFPLLLPGVMGNDKLLSIYGFELAMNLDVTNDWHVYGGYGFLAIDGDTGMDGGDPRSKLYIQSAWEFAENWELDLTWRYVDQFSMMRPDGNNVILPSYNVMDVRVAWQARPGLELAVVGRNLLNPARFEFPSDPFLGNASPKCRAGCTQ